MVLAKITIKHSHARGVRGVATYRGSVCALYTMRVFPCSEVCGLAAASPNALFMPDSELWRFLEHVGAREVFRFIYDITL